MLESAVLLFILVILAHGTSTWPSTRLIYPPSGILIQGVGRATNITFDVTGTPFPEERKWYKDGEEITDFSNMNVDESLGNLISLKFNSLAKANEGVYYMIVRESKNTQEASKSLEVRLKVSFLEAFQDNGGTDPITVQLGGYAVLPCNPPRYFATTPKFEWHKGGTKVLESDSVYISDITGDLVIMQVAPNHYSADYRCSIIIDSLRDGEKLKQGPPISLIATGSAASYVPPEMALAPQDRSIDAQMIETFRVECAVNGYPALPSIRWFKDNIKITASSMIYDLQKRNYLQITIPRRGGNPSGQYRCEAFDSTRTISRSANIVIQTKPILTTGLPDAEVKKAAESTLDLSCEADSIPSPSYRWYRNAVEIIPDDIHRFVDGGNLTIINLSAQSRGVYQCEAHNTIGSTISSSMIRVQERLTFVIRPQDVEVFLGRAATFNCQGMGNPGPTSLRWEFNGQTPPDNHEFTNTMENQDTYTIPRITAFERNGRVSCIISSPNNLYPEDTASAIVTIREGPQVTATRKNITVTETSSVDMTCIVENVATRVDWKWLFKGSLITQDDEGRVTINNNLLQVRGLTGDDQGTYTCQADESGLSNQDTMFVMVKTHPRITLEPTIRIGEGADARLSCQVTANPAPTITWYRAGSTITPSNKYIIDEVNDNLSILIVTDVRKLTDTGTYTCEAQNELSRRESEVELLVVAPCEVMVIPKDQEVNYQDTVMVSCTVNTCPTAQFTWLKNGRPVVFDGSRIINRGSSIELRQLVPTDGGEYSCVIDSNNALNKVLTYNATITVSVRATIEEYPPAKVLYKGGDTVEMTCKALGDDSQSSLLVQWFKSNELINTGQPEIQKDTVERISYVKSKLLITSAIASDAGHYRCVASNVWSSDTIDTSLMLMTAPGQPGQPYNSWTGVGAVELSWIEPLNTGNTPLTSYEIHIETKGNNIFRPFLKGLAPSKVSTIIYFLQENQQYNFKVIAVNAVGEGPHSTPSNEIRTIKTTSNRQNLVENFFLESISSDSIKVRWEMPARRNNLLRGYKVVYRNEDKFETARFKVIDDYTMLETTIDELDGGSLYSVQVESNAGSGNELTVSTVKSTYTQNQRPTPPAECTARRDTSSRLIVSWNQPESPHGKILHYTIYYHERGNPNVQPTVFTVEDAQATSVSLTLENDSIDYDAKITASNSAGEGEAFDCINDGKTMNVLWYSTWWFYLIIALVAAICLGLIIVIIILCIRRSSSKKNPKMQKIPPVTAKKDDFRGPNAQVYSPNTARSYNPPAPAFQGVNMGSPYNTARSAGDFKFGTQPKSPDYAPDYSYNPKAFNTFDSRATYNDPPKPSFSGGYDPPGFYDPPKAYNPPSPKPYGAYDQGSNYDNQSRYDGTFRDNASRGYPTYDPYSYNGGAGGGNFKSSQL